MFKFDFALDDVEDDGTPTETSTVDEEIQENVVKFEEISLEKLLDVLPPTISCSPLNIPLVSGRTVTLPRRDVFDARFQLIAEEEETAENDEPSALELINAPSDLIPGVYEGGLRLWECSLDLVDYLDGLKDKQDYAGIHGEQIIEIGCGTAIPSIYLLHELFNSPVQDVQTRIHLQDYNASVLSLMTLPNIIFSWYMSLASTAYRDSVEDDLPPPDPSIPADLPISTELKAAFLSSLDTYRIVLRFFAGPWQDFGVASPYDMVLTSETIYNNKSLPSLLDLMERACGAGSKDVALEDPTAKLSLSSSSYICLVAAKVLYFGVGGGVSEFTKKVEEKGRGSVETVWEKNVGVGRRIMSVKWGT
ncbi:hypothetical protein C8J56DRAFT_90802 [Mycena floridula]|nr:hypothetical protein C8J56DRAFT_90802 [Mycena floridula]